MLDAIVTLRGRAAWAHNFSTARDVTAIFQTLPASAFVVNGAAQARDSALVSASAETRWMNGFSIAATFEGEFSNVRDSCDSARSSSDCDRTSRRRCHH
jgi:uncharacterized protein with beta-barrel porin domain